MVDIRLIRLSLLVSGAECSFLSCVTANMSLSLLSNVSLFSFEISVSLQWNKMTSNPLGLLVR